MTCRTSINQFKRDLMSNASSEAVLGGMKPITAKEFSTATARAAFHLGVATERGEKDYHYHLERRK